MVRGWAREMAQQIKVLATKRDDPSSIPRNHIMGEKNRLLQVVFWPVCVCDVA